MLRTVSISSPNRPCDPPALNSRIRAKMYKTRLKSWGCRKNISLRDSLHGDVVQLALHEDRNGSIQLPNGQVVDRKRLATHIRRRLQGRGAAFTTRGATHAPRLPAMRPPNTFYIAETVLFSVRTYILGEYQGKVTTAEELDALRRGNTGSAKWSRFTYAVKAALNEDKFNQALVLMRQAPGELKVLLDERPVNLVSQIFMFLAHLTRRPFSDDSQRR